MIINRRKMKFYRRKINFVLTLSIILLTFTIGYAFLNTTVNITGTGYIDRAEWNVHFANIQVKNGSVTATTVPTISNNTSVSFAATLDDPGDFYEFIIDVVNSGTIPAMIDSFSITPTLTTEQSNYFKYSVTYSDGVALANKHLLNAGDTETLKISFEYKTLENAALYPFTDQSFQFGLTINYVQADSTAIEVPHLRLGDYISLTPSANSYTIPSSITGYSSDQIINPSELNLWRIIDIHNDGTIDAVSEYTSSTTITFDGITGYANIVGALQTIAAQYAKTGYRQSVRMMGYDGQTLTISDTSAFNGLGDSSNLPSKTSTPQPITGTGEEFFGGIAGDTLYLKDCILVNNVYGNIIANQVGTTTASTYWLATRRFYYVSDLEFYFRGRRVTQEGSLTSNYMQGYIDGSWNHVARSYAVRPIITLNSIILSGGNGEKASPYTLS